jgi:hypothetical protein
MALEDNAGQMEQSMKVTGSIIKHKARENSLTPMETIMRESGLTTRPMATEYMFIAKLEPVTKDIGKMICSMALEFRFTAMVINMKECSNKAGEMAKELIITRLEKFIKAVGLTAELKALGFASGLTEKGTKVNG